MLRTAIIAGPSDTLVARCEDVVLVVDRGEPGHDSGSRALLQLVRNVRDAEPADRPRILGRRALELLAPGQQAEAPAFGLMIAMPDGVAIMLHDAMTATWTTIGGDGTSATISGSQSLSGWVERVIPHPVGGLILYRNSRDTSGSESIGDLIEGVVPGAGIVSSFIDQEVAQQLEPPAPSASYAPSTPGELPESSQHAGERSAHLTTVSVPSAASDIAASPPPTALPSRPPSQRGDHVHPGGFVVFDLSPSRQTPAAPAPSEPVTSGPVIDAPDAPPRVAVEGVRCTRGHFNHPKAAYCNLCGIGLLQITKALVPGERPPLGIIVLDDGAAFTLDRDYVLGREPSGHTDVLAGRASPLQLEDAARKVSRFHAELRMQGWDVTLIDKGSTNGTFVMPTGSKDWTPVASGRPATLRHGTRVAVGSRTFVYRSHHVTS